MLEERLTASLDHLLHSDKPFFFAEPRVRHLVLAVGLRIERAQQQHVTLVTAEVAHTLGVAQIFAVHG